jgi:DNA-3-methyladenine glycosylase II
MTPLDERSLRRAVRSLVNRHADLASIHDRHGCPPLWQRPAGFPTLLHIILEQQVSIASARAAFDRLCAVATPLTPRTFLDLDDAELQAVGFSRQKIEYARGLAEAVARRRLRLNRLVELDDEGVRAELMSIRGIGRWSADIYLLMALGRPDVWPRGDLALAQAMSEVLRLEQRPTHDEKLEISSRWQPWRAVAARLLWHHYLSTPRRSRGDADGESQSRTVAAQPRSGSGNR